MEEKARYQELLQSLNVNSFRRNSTDISSLLEQSPRPSTSSFQLDSSIQELRRLQKQVYCSPISAKNRFSSYYPTKAQCNGRFKSIFAYAKHSLENLDKLGNNSQPKLDAAESFTVSSTPDVISLDGEDILANYGLF